MEAKKTKKAVIAALMRKQAAIAYRTDKKIKDDGSSRDKPAEILIRKKGISFETPALPRVKSFQL